MEEIYDVSAMATTEEVQFVSHLRPPVCHKKPLLIKDLFPKEGGLNRG
jgi:hypothetical protein